MQRWSSDREGGIRYPLSATATLDHATQQQLIARYCCLLRGGCGKASRQGRKKQDAQFLAAARAHEAKLETEAHAAREKETMASLLTKKSELAVDPLIAILVGLAPADRDRIATAAERRDAVALRKASLLAGKVKAFLGCTKTELDRRDRDDRLPHLYVRALKFERPTLCLF